MRNRLILMAPTGFSTGCMFRSRMAIGEVISLYSQHGMDAIEILFDTPEMMFSFKPKGEALKTLKSLDSIAMHAPCTDMGYRDDVPTKKVLRKLGSLCSAFPVDGIVIHPDVVDDFDVLGKSGLDFLIENMDRNRKKWISPEEFAALRDGYGFGFVLDIEHAWEHDRTMGKAREFLRVMGNRLRRIHASGWSAEGGHALLHECDNRDSLGEFLKSAPEAPVTLEGVLPLDGYGKAIDEELAYARKLAP